MTSREMVAEFMRHIGSETHDEPTDRDAAIAAVRTQLMMEELLETHAAMSRGDVAEAADGLADLKYVVVGAAVAYGVPLEDFFYAPGPSREAPTADAANSLAAACLPRVSAVVDALMGNAALPHALRKLDVALSMEAAMLGLPLRELFAEVHASNMTKESGYRIGAAKYGPGGGKGPSYSPPDVAGVLRRAGWAP